MLDLSIVDPPGMRFNYCTGCSHLLTAIVEQATGMGALDFARQALFEPLGFESIEWQTDAQGIPVGGWGLQLTPREMARLGYLYLRGGRWKDQQVVSTQWVQVATTDQVAAEPGFGYGYQWWVRPSIQGYAAIGRGGQMVAVIPGKDLVVVFTSSSGDSDSLFKLIEDYVLPAVK
jgi:CubicO group peptidase (beta-lactamase class C family)